MHLPNTLRPNDSSYREFTPGIDLPSWFMDDLKSIDHKLYIIWHPLRVMWDNIINQYEGELEDPRFTIHQEHGEENWGFVLTDHGKAPIPEQAWHVWRLCDPHGWAHVVKVEDKHPVYLSLLTKRLAMQAGFRDKYGDIAWNRKLSGDQEEDQTKAIEDKQEMFAAVQEENSWLTKRAMDNMDRGITAPTNPQTGQIISYPGQKNRSTIERPLMDDDVGLIGFDD